MLLVKPNYKDGWILPGGTVEAGEAPKPGCEREIVEELGLDVKLGRVLLIFHGLSLGVWGDSTYYMYDGGVIAADTKITLQDAELVTYEWVAPRTWKATCVRRWWSVCVSATAPWRRGDSGDEQPRLLTTSPSGGYRAARRA